jgi:hypothetical protein
VVSVVALVQPVQLAIKRVLFFLVLDLPKGLQNFLISKGVAAEALVVQPTVVLAELRLLVMERNRYMSLGVRQEQVLP